MLFPLFCFYVRNLQEENTTKNRTSGTTGDALVILLDNHSRKTLLMHSQNYGALAW